VSSSSLYLETVSSDSLAFEIEVFRHPDQGVIGHLQSLVIVISDSKVIFMGDLNGHLAGHFGRSFLLVIFGH